MSDHPATLRTWLAGALRLLLVIAMSPLLLLALTIHLILGSFLHLLVWCCWCPRGRYVLFVYSDSPNWQNYVEFNLLPRLGERAVVLNWSHRRQWKWTLPVLLFRYFGGSRSFNPLALVFRPFRPVRVFRFYVPFLELKHGRPEALAEIERQLFGVVDEVGSR